ncbi:MAG: VOC family protein [Pseudomonadota bacterium]
MNLTWSHAVMYVRDLENMLDFYTNILGFEITDQGPIGPEITITFLSQNPDEHHQLAMIPTRKSDDPPNSVNHMAFRTDEFDRLKALHETLSTMEGIRINPLSHGNTLSIYFNDPEGNGIEVFWDTPWHVAQPQGQPWDTSLDEPAATRWVEDTFKGEPTFEPRENYYQRRHAESGQETKTGA